MSTQQRAHRLRIGRCSESGRIYLITAVTHQRQLVFQDWRIGRLLVSEFRQAQDEGEATSLAWVVMPDHFHWLIELHNGDLPRLMRITKSRSARAINQARCSFGTLWQKEIGRAHV